MELGQDILAYQFTDLSLVRFIYINHSSKNSFFSPQKYYYNNPSHCKVSLDIWLAQQTIGMENGTEFSTYFIYFLITNSKSLLSYVDVLNQNKPVHIKHMKPMKTI